ncbi:MAG: HAD-IA family hydrolase [Bacteroides sp.]|nr:HAD-IA family hydrolase [Bacteroides sp.]
MKMKLIIFDFDGTLADTRQLIVETMQQTIQALELTPCTDEQCASMIGLPLKQAFIELIPMSDEMGDRCVDTYRRIFNENNALYVIPTFPNVIDTLFRLSAEGYILTIASSRSRKSLLDFVHTMHLEEIFSYILGADDVIHAKPHPEPVLRTLEAFDCSPEEALVVGDMKYDIEMGRRAGTRTCGVTYGNGSPQDLREARADFIVNNFEEILTLI